MILYELQKSWFLDRFFFVNPLMSKVYEIKVTVKFQLKKKKIFKIGIVVSSYDMEGEQASYSVRKFIDFVVYLMMKN